MITTFQLNLHPAAARTNGHPKAAVCERPAWVEQRPLTTMMQVSRTTTLSTRSAETFPRPTSNGVWLIDDIADNLDAPEMHQMARKPHSYAISAQFIIWTIQMEYAPFSIMYKVYITKLQTLLSILYDAISQMRTVRDPCASFATSLRIHCKLDVYEAVRQARDVVFFNGFEL